MKRHINPPNVHEPFSSYTHCVEVKRPGRFLFCSGQVPADTSGELQGKGDFAAQGDLVVSNLEAVLASADAKLSDIAKLTTFICREQDVSEVRALLKRHFGEQPPANSVCIVQGLADPEVLIEMEATAVT
ncbi:enamine deaminase RidA (YjgF/YER057c/UK114 family) [Kushneria sinocarnis]|uniref:Enamine deaminase RidA (YjgF/YER057c/UK114 family) n=1 Tax=Kushneria sinocarnis TaxID=595502 RepID=A0A420WWS8_9GAMM|nr:RidA family protein [Kushneria sinocarnis]RKR03554.1 enamine deaminase RidA (YjgF/YER057c/UK114 family) [Kushneria sinocarnis]